MRLTKRNADGIACSAKPFEISTFDMFDKLAAYEDTGLSPEEFRERTESVLELYGKLKPYADAEEQGRLVILPCKVNDTFWWIERLVGDGKPFIRSGQVSEIGISDAITIYEYDGRDFAIADVYFTREEAEDAWKGGQDDG